MPKNKPESKQATQSREMLDRELPPGVKLRHTLRGHKDWIGRIAWSPDGRMIASPSSDKTIRIWDAETGRLIRTLKGHSRQVFCVAWSPDGLWLASGSEDSTVNLWESGKLVRKMEGHNESIKALAWSPDGELLASGGSDSTIRLWKPKSAQRNKVLRGHTGQITSVAWSPDGQMLVSSSDDGTIRLREYPAGQSFRTDEVHRSFVWSVAWSPEILSHTLASAGDDLVIQSWGSSDGSTRIKLEGQTGEGTCVHFSPGGDLLALKEVGSKTGTIRLWRCDNWETVAAIPEPASGYWPPGIAFHPSLPLLATVGSDLDAPRETSDRLIHIWELDLDVLLGKGPAAKVQTQAVHHTTAKIVVVGDSGVGKTGLGWMLAHNEYKEHSSTHGQQFWVLDQLTTRRPDGTECEAILWDLAGQPDYRLTHALFLDDSDLALILFDPTDSRDPLHGVEFWLKQLRSGQHTESGEEQSACPIVLVGARADRGEARLTQEELDEFCRQRGITGGYLATSAKENIGLDELLRRMKDRILWDQKTKIVTTVTFKRIKDFVLGLKEKRRRKNLIVSPQDLRKLLEKTDKKWKFSDDEMMTAVRNLGNYGYIRVLRTSQGEDRILLTPELLNNLAASFVLEARRNPKGLGSLEEKPLLAGEYKFRELEKLPQDERNILLDSAALLFLKHNICFRETDPLGGKSYLVFPELINLKKPLLDDEQKTEDGIAYTVSGAIENVYASLVVLLGYTQAFTRTNQWQNQAHYVMGDGSICGFRQESNHEGELEFVLYFGVSMPKPSKKVFEGLVERFLARHNLTVFRYEPVICSNGHALNRAVMRERLRDKDTITFCSKCGEKLTLPKADEPIQLTQAERRKVEEQQRFAARRSRFEQAVFQFMTYVQDQELSSPECFISYAWGDKKHERWVERDLATDLQKAGITVVLDKWENTRVGASVARFVERIAQCDKVIVVGTPAYKKKYANKNTGTGFVVAAEGDLINLRMLRTEADKESVLPVLLAGNDKESLPVWLQGRVYADFRDDRAYFTTAFDLIISLYGISQGNPAVADLRESLKESEMRYFD